MSQHLDAPDAAQNGPLYIDDLYVFSGGDSTVFVMDLNSTIMGPNAQPGFDTAARCEFKVHLGGTAVEALTYRVSFDAPGGDGRQPLQLHALRGDEASDDSAIGRLVLEGWTGQTCADGDIRIWAGRKVNSFYVDLSLLYRVNSAVKNGTAVDLSGWNPAEARNSFEGTTVESIVLAVSHHTPGLQPGTRIGVWGATKLATHGGGWRQINRAGHPMMGPIFWPDHIAFSHPANTRHPSEDVNAVGDHLAAQVAAVVAAGGTVDHPQGYGQTVAKKLLPDVLSYVVGTPASFGFAALNGRTLADNAPEVMLSLVAGTAIPSGLKPSVSKRLRGDRFPYVLPA